MNRTYVTICLVFLCNICIAKENKDLMKANFYYTHSAYYKAIPYFEKVADVFNDPVIYTELGNCYSLTNEPQKAANAYGKAVNMAGCDKVVLMRYAEVLMQLQRYDDAAQSLKKYQESYPNDRRAVNMINGCRTAKNIAAEGNMPEGVAIMLGCNTDGSDFAPTLWKGNLVFASDTDVDVKKKTDRWTGRAYYNIFSVACEGKGQCNGAMEKINSSKGVNIKYHDGPCTFSADGKVMYFTRSRSEDRLLGMRSVSNKDSVVVLEIMIASDYDSAAKKFRTIEPFAYNNEAYAVEHPAVTPDGKTLVFSSNMPNGNGGADLYMSQKVGDAWSAPKNLGNVINTEGEEVFPYWADDHTLFFSSDGHEGLGGLDIYKSQWNESSNTFSKPENAGTPINSSYDDISLAITADEHNTYFSSNRPAIKESDNIYFYKKEKVFLLLTVLDSLTLQPIAGADIKMTGKETKVAASDNNGQYFTRLFPESQYSIGIKKDSYFPDSLDVTASGNKETDTLFRIVKLHKPVPPTPPSPPPSTTHTRDVIPPIVPRHPNVMDTPGIREFKVGELYELGHFYYDLNKYSLKEKHKIILDTLMAQLTRHPTMRIQIRAHTDCRGSFDYNMDLSKNRALAVVEYLVEHGINKNRLEYVGLGYTMPTVFCACEECTEAEHELNRLLEFKVLQL